MSGRQESSEQWAGAELELGIERIAHGGFCVARHDGRVVFVRHTLPGERVRAVVTEDRGGSFCRADAIEVIEAAPQRVPAPCPHAGPGACGGCDFQHVSAEGQRELKAMVVAEQLHRLGGLALPRPVTVEAMPRHPEPLGWRTNARLAVDGAGRAGFRAARSHDVVEIEECPLLRRPAAELLAQRWTPGSELELLDDDAGGRHCVEHLPGGGRRRHQGHGRARLRARGRQWRVSVGGFWQAHVDAAETYADVVDQWCGARPGELAWDLYAGVGLFAAVLAERVGPDGRVEAVEGSRRAVEDGRAALRDLPQVRFTARPVAAALPGMRAQPAVVVLDPPRRGAGTAVLGRVAERAPRRIVYVACDPAALGRDAGVLAGLGYRLTRLRCFDAFPMTYHVECLALFEPDDHAAPGAADPLLGAGQDPQSSVESAEKFTGVRHVAVGEW